MDATSTDQQTQLELPSWLAAPPNLHPTHPTHPEPYYHPEVIKARRQARAAQQQLDEIAFESLFDEFLDMVRENGLGTRQLFDNDPRTPDLKKFIAWVMRDEARKVRYYEAQEIGAEVLMVETPMIADANDSIEDVNRSTLRVNTRKWQMGVFNRRRFGDIKQIEQNVTIDLSGAMQEAQARIDRARTVDAVDVTDTTVRLTRG